MFRVSALTSAGVVLLSLRTTERQFPGFREVADLFSQLHMNVEANQNSRYGVWTDIWVKGSVDLISSLFAASLDVSFELA